MREVTYGTPDCVQVLHQVVRNLDMRPDSKKPETEFDYGDDRTLGLHVKLVGVEIKDPNWKGGIYGGKVDDKFAIVRTSVMFEIEAIELFDTEEEMKKKWRLD